MNARTLGKRLLPPVVFDGLRRMRESGGRAEYEVTPLGWRHPGVRGWDVEAIARTQRERWPSFLERLRGTGPLGMVHDAPAGTPDDVYAHNIVMSFGYVLALASRRLERLSMLDWGAGVGHYYALAQALLPGVPIDYHGQDLPRLAREARALWKEASSEVCFHEADDSCAGRTYDLVVASGSLQYSEDWRGVAGRLAAATGSWLYVTRLPVVEHEASFVVLQRVARYGYDTEYLGWVLRRREFLDVMEGLGFELQREFMVQPVPPMRGAREPAEQRGYLFRPRSGGRA